MWLRVKQLAMLAMCGMLAGCGGSSGGGSVSLTCHASGTPEVCLTTENGAYNGLGVRRFVRFSVTGTRAVSISAQCVSGSDTDPDLVLYRNGQEVARAIAVSLNQESMSTTLSQGDYVLELLDYNHYNSDTLNTSCYNIDVHGLVALKTAAGVQSVAEKITPPIIVQALPSSCSTASQITVNGTVTYDRVPHNPNHSLDYARKTQEPVRGAVVELICAGDVYDSTVTSGSGVYSLNAPNGINSFVRVKAQMLQSGTPSWNFRVEDNFSSNALYVMDSAVFSSVTNITGKDLNAESGWDVGAASYTTTRVAAPFAILDSVYVAFQRVLEADSNAVFPALNINWSANNVAIPGDVSLGRITTSHYDSNTNEIYILGKADDDTDEYDDHVVIHEWGHYFERQFSRADNIGGEHSLSDIKDIRVAFGEGWGNAFSAIASNDPIYSDATGVGQAGGFGFNLESNNCFRAGWYSECSVQSILYDIYDGVDDGVDTLSLGFAPIYNVLTTDEKNTPALTSIFSFIKPLKDARTSQTEKNWIDALVTGQNMDVITDIYGDSQLTNNPGTVNQLPVYLQY